MFTPVSASQANSSTNSDMIALQAIANMRFITLSTDAINNAIAQGLYFVTLSTFADCNLTNLMNYYNGLGYQIGVPDLHFVNQPERNPFSLYGVDYFDWLTHTVLFSRLKNPTRLRISWTVPTNPAATPVISTQTTNYTMSQNNETVFADSTSSSLTISLPASPGDGWVETITKPVAANTVTVNGNGNNINGSANPVSLSDASSSVTLIFTSSYGWSTFP